MSELRSGETKEESSFSFCRPKAHVDEIRIPSRGHTGMSQTECFVCHELVKGDSEYFQFHLNQCLDASGSSSEPSTSSSGSQEAKREQEKADSEAARELAKKIDNDAVIAARLKDAGVPFRAEDGDEGAMWDGGQEEEGCPICGRSWNDLKIGMADRDGHVGSCLEGDGDWQGGGEEADGAVLDFGKGKGKEKETVIGVPGGLLS
jgi:hypothetical protein